MENMTPIILVRQKHLAERAGEHFDLRVVVGDKAYSWATKKEMPELGKPTIIFEQPVHDRKYALSRKVVIPKGQYGAGVTTLDFAQKGKAKIIDGEYHLDLNNKERFFLKRLNPERYGENAWLFARKRTYDEKEALLRELEEKRKLKKNPYLEKVAEKKSNEEPRTYTSRGRVGTVIGAYAAPLALGTAAASGLSNISDRVKTPGISEADVQSYRRAKNLRHANRTEAYSQSESHYSPSVTKGVRPSIHSTDPAVTLHEYGHAHSYNKTRKINRAKIGILSGSRIATNAGLAGLAGAYAGSSDNEKVRNAAPYIAAATTVPSLWEEGAANMSPYKHLRKTRGAAVANQFLKKVIPNYGTYLALAGAATAPSIITKKITDHKVEKRDRSK